MHRARPAAAAVIPLAAMMLVLQALPAAAEQGCPPDAAPDCEAASTRAASLIEAGTTGGTYGFVLAEVGGPVRASRSAEVPFYPASSIKALHHLHALLWVQQQGLHALDTPIPVYADTCAGAGASREEPLRDLLAAMMLRSDNARTNAIQDFFGVDALEATAARVGMAGTAVHHRFGCGGPANDPANVSTAADLAALYRAVADGSLLDAGHRSLFDSFMLDEGTGILDDAVATAADLPVSGRAREEFASRLHLVSKAGWYGPRLSIAGLAEIPTRWGTDTFVFAVWVEPDHVDAAFTVEAVVGDLLRDPIRDALRSLAVAWRTRPLWAPLPD